MENILISSKLSKKTKKILLGITFCTLIIGIIISILGYILKLNINEDEYFSYFYSVFCYFDINSILFVIFCSLSLLSILYYWLICKMAITVTDKRVYGKTAFGRSIDLPLDSISSVGSSMFNGIAVATSSGKIKFLFIENAQSIRNEITNLLISRQKEQKDANKSISPTNNADEIKKYKELLDSGVITEDEFNQKKKQLLGL